MQEIAPPAEQLRAQLEDAQEELRGRSERALTGLRFIGALLFASLAAFLGFALGHDDWRVLAGPLLAYAALTAILAVFVRRSGPRSALGQASPAIDVLCVFYIQLMSLSVSPFPAGVAGWTLGAFVVLLLLGSLSLQRRAIAATALLAWICEAALQRTAGVGWGAVAASGVILGLATAVTALAAQRLEEVVARLVQQEVSNRLEQRRGDELSRTAELERQAHAALSLEHERLLVAQREAETLSRLVVHDMKGPLSSVLALVEVASETLELTPASARDDLRIAVREGNRLLAMTGDLLALARLEEGALRASPQPTPLRPFLEEVCEAFSAEARQREATVSLDAPAGAVGRLDPQLTRRLLDNLVSNTFRYLRKGDLLELAASLAGDELLLSVRNSGPEIGPEVRPLLFQKHVQSGQARHNAGLGLYFCRLVAEAHGGRIALEETPGWAVSFVVRLPAQGPRHQINAPLPPAS